MRRTRLVVALLVAAGVLVSLAAADEQKGEAHHNTSSIVPEDRYEIMQSSRYADVTIRLDKFSGKTWETVALSGALAWKEIRWEERGDDTPVRAEVVNYQFLTSGLTGTTFLWNVHTGQTWYLTIEPARRNFFWRAVREKR
ncbi:MAG: hypothetical protein ACYTGT_19210 [Planctomycetota bacterium]|jgi:hypothetical protein